MIQAERLFRGVKQAGRSVSAGEVQLPILYRDASVVSVLFAVPADPVASILAEAGMSPATALGRALLNLTVFEYRDSTVGSYNELSVGFVARPAGLGLGALGIWVHQLPVTTEIARVAGREIWGYPKWVAPIGWERRRSAIVATLGDELVLEVEASEARWGGASVLPAPAISLPLVTYTVLDGRVIRTKIRARAPLHLVGRSCVRVELRGDGQVAALLRRLGADRASAAFGLWSDRFQAILPAGRAVAGVPARA